DGDALARLSEESSDLEIAFNYLLERRPLPEWEAFARGLWTLFRLQGWFRDGARLIDAALAAPGVPLEIATRWRLWLTEAWFQLGEHRRCREETLAALEHCREPVPETGGALRPLLRELA